MASAPTGPEVGHVHVVGLDEHARPDEPHLHREHVAVAPATGIEEIANAVFPDNLANLLLPRHGLRRHRDGFVIGADQEPVRIVEPVHAELL